MRVAHVIDNLNVGGAQRLIVTLAGLAPAHDIELTVVTLSDNRCSPIPENLAALGVHVATFLPRSLFDPFLVRRLARYLSGLQLDIVQTHLSTANILGTLAARSADVPVVGTLHSAASRPRHRHHLDRAMETWTLRYGARQVIAVGHFVAEAHQSRLRNKPITVIPNGVGEIPCLGLDERTRLRTQLIGDPARPLVISVGRLTPAKGFSDLVTAFADVRDHHPSAALVVVGSGTLHIELQRHIYHHGLQDHVFLAGARDDVPSLLASSDLYVSSSHWEGLPLTVLEAMMAGLPIVATGVGEIPLVLEDGAGVVVPTRDPIAIANVISSLLAHPDRMRSLGSKARTRAVREYSATAWMHRLSKLYADNRRVPAAG